MDEVSPLKNSIIIQTIKVDRVALWYSSGSNTKTGGTGSNKKGRLRPQQQAGGSGSNKKRAALAPQNHFNVILYYFRISFRCPHLR